MRDGGKFFLGTFVEARQTILSPFIMVEHLNDNNLSSVSETETTISNTLRVFTNASDDSKKAIGSWSTWRIGDGHAIDIGYQFKRFTEMEQDGNEITTTGQGPYSSISAQDISSRGDSHIADLGGMIQWDQWSLHLLTRVVLSNATGSMSRRSEYRSQNSRRPFGRSLSGSSYNDIPA